MGENWVTRSVSDNDGREFSGGTEGMRECMARSRHTAMPEDFTSATDGRLFNNCALDVPAEEVVLDQHVLDSVPEGSEGVGLFGQLPVT